MKDKSQMSDEDLDENNDSGIKDDEDELSNRDYESDEEEAYKNDNNYKESDVDEDDVYG